jgi:hypothetical protein
MTTYSTAAVVIAAATLTLSACGGRPANPVAAVQPSDGKMNCQLIQVEYGSNEARARSLAGEKKDAEKQNAAKVVLMGMTGLLALDLKKTEEVEIRALKDRNDHLARLMAAKDCPNAPPVAQPAKSSDAASETGGESTAVPSCKDVGGYEAYLKKTGKVCVL